MSISVNGAPKLKVKGLNKRFRDLEVLRDVSLDVPEGGFVSLVGPSGCGKTTILRIVDGLESPDSGEVEIDGQPIRGPGADRAFAFQSDSLLPWRTVRGNVLIGLEINKRSTKQDHERVQSLLDLVGLRGFEGYYPRQLSGGMRQRANLARALAVEPEVLLMDEPFAALDAQTREIMQAELLRIWSSDRKTVLFITHQIDEAVYLSDQVVVLGRRPGHIREIIPIDLPRPRELTVKREQAFTVIGDKIWKLIEKEVRESVVEAAIV